MRSAVVEAETREEVMREMEERIQEIEKRFTRRLMNEVRLYVFKISYAISTFTGRVERGEDGCEDRYAPPLRHDRSGV